MKKTILLVQRKMQIALPVIIMEVGRVAHFLISFRPLKGKPRQNSQYIHQRQLLYLYSALVSPLGDGRGWLFIALSLCATLNSSAQNETGFDLGLSGTFSSTWILKQNNYGTLAPFANAEVRASEMAYKKTWGGNGGVCLGYKITKHWGIQAEVQYNVTGQNYNDNFEGPAYLPHDTVGSTSSRVNVQRTVKLNYIQIPIMAKFVTGKKKYKFYACLGPQIGIRTYAYEQVKIAGIVYLPDSLNYTADQRFQKVDVGFAVQTGAQLYATPHLYFDLGLSAYEGIIDINGKALQELGWYDKNHLSYQKSYNFRGGIMLGIHYIFWHQRGGLLNISSAGDKK